MAKGNMIFVGVEQLKGLCKGTNLRPIDLERTFKVSHAGFYKWLAKGIIPVDKLGHLLVLNKFNGYEIEEKPKIGSENPKELDFMVKDFFAKHEHLYIEAKPSDANLEVIRMQINAFKVPVTLLYLSKGEIKMEENLNMRQRLSGNVAPNPQSVASGTGLSSASLDDLVQEIEKRGWLIKLERKNASSLSGNAKATKKLKK